MKWNDKNTAEMLRLYNLGLTGVQIGERLRCSPDSVRGRKRTLIGNKEGRRSTSGAVGKNTQRVTTNKYKVFRVRNTVTGVVFKISGMGDELPDKSLKSATIGEIRLKMNKRIKHMMEYERIL